MATPRNRCFVVVHNSKRASLTETDARMGQSPLNDSGEEQRKAGKGETIKRNQRLSRQRGERWGEMAGSDEAVHTPFTAL